MGLYGDLPQARNSAASSAAADTSTSTWASAKPQPAPFRKPSILAPPAALLRAGRGTGRGAPTPGRGAPAPGRAAPIPDAAATATPSGGLMAATSGGGPGGFNILAQAAGQGLVDEYDPARPNEYEEVIREREQRKKEALAEEERQARRREMLREQEERRQAELAAEQRRAASTAAASSSSGGSAPAAAGAGSTEEARSRALNISGEEAWLRRAALSGRLPVQLPPAPGPPPDGGDDGGAGGAAKGMNLAKNLLQKMGWREGEGLGRNRQGISAPLMAQKTDRRAGVIVPAAPPPGSTTTQQQQQEEPAEKKPRMGATWQGTPTRVVCLRNMVGPGEVDEELEEEVGQELLRYGQVTSVLIFEVTTAGWPPEEAVRIFVQFDRSEAATKALVDLQGRFFGGRQVRAAFFDEGRFDRADLAPQAGEFG